MLSAEDLLAGAKTSEVVEIPESLLAAGEVEAVEDRRVRIKPLSVHELRLIVRAARDNGELTAALMVQRALVEPALTMREVSAMPVGLLHFLLHCVNRISGISASEEELLQAVEDPLTRATFALSRQFGWTPDEIGEMTIGQLLTHLQMLRAEPAARE